MDGSCPGWGGGWLAGSKRDEAGFSSFFLIKISSRPNQENQCSTYFFCLSLWEDLKPTCDLFCGSSSLGSSVGLMPHRLFKWPHLSPTQERRQQGHRLTGPEHPTGLPGEAGPCVWHWATLPTTWVARVGEKQDGASPEAVASHPRDVGGGGPHAPSPSSKGTTEHQRSSQASSPFWQNRCCRGGQRGGRGNAGKSMVRHLASRVLSPGLSGQDGTPCLSKGASPSGQVLA